jgi:hypothetical protein
MHLAILQGKLPQSNDPNWHLNKLKPWQGQEAMLLGNKYRDEAMRQNDPFEKVRKQHLLVTFPLKR